jgi:hypothetical protein
MRKCRVLVICAFFVSCKLFSQTNEVIRIKAGHDPSAGYSPHGFYRFPAFNEGIAVFKDGSQTAAKFNYHELNGEMQFITTNGDTLAIADPVSIKHITVNNTLFYYLEGYLEALINNDSLKLARKLRLNLSWEKIGGYGQPSPSGSIRSPNRIILANTGKALSLNQDLLIQKDYSYFWIDKYNTVFKASKVNLLKIVPPNSKNPVEDYLKKNKIDFRKEPDLKRLHSFALTVM